MKKATKKLRLSRETIELLSAKGLEEVHGAWVTTFSIDSGACNGITGCFGPEI